MNGGGLSSAERLVGRPGGRVEILALEKKVAVLLGIDPNLSNEQIKKLILEKYDEKIREQNKLPDFPAEAMARTARILEIDEKSPVEKILAAYRKNWKNLIPKDPIIYRQHLKDWNPEEKSDAELILMLMERFGNIPGEVHDNQGTQSPGTTNFELDV
jgi:hypothetical protein